uniref:Telomerase reverse transcriptase n=1 Tax=Kwoniella bestiolae CBS 10118 TaxID=1296100 RepID=A0A1B9FUA0_9TREE|nr:hypothetical protein I302_08000 [Kwoniella bestiolae CBS 10118]OCF22353.1 hypothetical protein I302_08000 [Kwoniella bestiolae CBS 10118]
MDTPGEGSTKPLRHKTLSAYYPTLHTLSTFLSSTYTAENRVISKPSDPGAYVKLLDHTICVFRSAQDASELQIKLRDCRRANGLSQQEAINCILRDLARIGEKNFPSVELPINISRPHVDNRHVNSPSSVLRETEWKLLRSRIGDEAFRLLLIHTSLFLPVGNNCFTQLSGVPVYELYDHSKIARAQAQTLPPEHLETPSQGSDELPSELGERNGKGKKRKRKGVDDIIVEVKKRKHILHKLASTNGQPANRDLLELTQQVFPSLFYRLSGDDELPRVRGNIKRLAGILGMIRELVARYRKTDFKGLLRRCKDTEMSLMRGYDGVENGKSSSQPITQVIPDTPLTSLDNKPSINAGRNETLPPLLVPVPHGQVCRYLTMLFRNLFSIDIMGSQHNLDTILSHARRFVKAKQYEPVNLHTLIQGVQINHFQWVIIDPNNTQRLNVSEAEKRRSLVVDFVRWVFSDFLIPLLRNTFYITETSTTRYETVYHTHEDWLRATKPHLEVLKDDLLVELNKTESYSAQQGPLGVSAVRLIPKPKGFRPIVNLGKKIEPDTAKGLTANQILKGVHQVLTFEKDRHRASLGASLFGTNEIFSPLQNLKVELIDKHGKIPKLYFVKMDIKAAFDTIKQDKMIQVVSDLLDKNHDYCLMLYCLLLPPASKASQGASRRLFKSRAVVDDHLASSFGEHAQEIAEPLRNAVIVDLVRRKQITRDSCMELLKIHIQNNVWQVGKQFYKQKIGIPQGSKISSLLCSFFYACMENDHLGFTRQEGSRLLRYIDDFLFVTDSIALARKFVDTMSKGFPTYGAEVSVGKTLLSFECKTKGHMGSVVEITADGETYRISVFPYCGFLLNTRSLDVMSDYPRLMSGPIKQSFALRSDRHRGSAFVGWFSRQLENRNHVAYLDTIHNRLDTVHFNIYTNFALTSMKIPFYFRSDDFVGLSGSREKLVADALISSAEYTYLAGRARVNHASRHDGKDHYEIKRIVFLFLAISAIVRVLKRKPRFRGVVGILGVQLKHRKYRGLERRLEGALDKGWEVVKDAKY